MPQSRLILLCATLASLIASYAIAQGTIGNNGLGNTTIGSGTPSVGSNSNLSGTNPASTDFETIEAELVARERDVLDRGNGTVSAYSCQGSLKSQTFDRPNGNSLKFYKNLADKIDAAKSALNIIKTACLENTSIPLQDFATAISQVNTQPSYIMGASLTEICHSGSNMFDKLKDAAAGYEAICGGAAATQIGRMNNAAKDAASFVQTCEGTKAEYDEMLAQDGQAGLANPQQAADAAELNKAKTSGACLFGTMNWSAGNKGDCGEDARYVASVIRTAAAKAKTESKNLVTAGMSLLMTAYSNEQLNDLCKTLTTVVDCNLHPTAATCITAPLNCNEAVNSNDQRCICLLHPGLAACLAGGAPNVSAGFGTASGGDNLGSANLGAGAGDLGTPFAAPNATAGSGGGAGAGSGGLGGGTGSSPAPAAAAKDAKKSDLNPNVLSGDSGSAGGAKSKTATGGDDAGTGAYGKFLPKADGKAKDLRVPASGAEGEITGANSKSNWEKVHDRYVDDKGTFLSKGP